ncbi:sterol desaturase family protein [Psychrobium sp. MM17-31]|uniref:sterol desaturase family protein n=1 Tax=Psychrobium sp. MM17-31 TaxID=2917758 RepID=UPI001EF4B9AD|nr:sterol desaturase family protein [Psychrobium sp. MM17-31]
MQWFNLLIETSIGTADWVWRNVTFDVPWTQNYFWALTIISLLVWTAEILFPWRKQQQTMRHGFWLDAWYMYFNFFVFSIAISGFYALMAQGFSSVGVTANSLAILDMSQWSWWLQLLVFFILLDFLQWFTHKMLHRVPVLWRFHQVHHSIKEMGFAGHLRYHPMENIFYKPLKTLGVMLLGGFEPQHAYAVHFLTIVIGHLNHANIKLDYGVLRYAINNPVMHLYHHSYQLPKSHPHGVNFGISLSVWDYLFNSAYVPETSGNLKLGYSDDHKMPVGFWGQLKHGFYK